MDNSQSAQFEQFKSMSDEEYMIDHLAGPEDAELVPEMIKPSPRAQELFDELGGKFVPP